jgi:hypothetical protein
MLASITTPEQQHTQDLHDGFSYSTADKLLAAAWRREYARRPSRHRCEINAVSLTTLRVCGVCGVEVAS